MSDSHLLEVRDITKSFGAVKTAEKLNFAIESGSVVGLIGPNGSGKSTLFNMISGYVSPDGGRIYFQGRDVTRMQPFQISKLGLVKGFQTARNFVSLAVLENLLLSPRNQMGERPLLSAIHSRWEGQEKQNARRSFERLRLTNMMEKARVKASDLSGGQRKLLDIIRVEMTEAKLFLLDEPTAGVAPSLAENIFAWIDGIRDSTGASFFVIEHRIETLLRFVDRVIVMNLGKIIYDGSPKDVVKHEQVLRVYLGE